MGGAMGLAAALALFLIPGIGPILAAGPLAAAMLGVAVGAGTGGVFGFLTDHDVSEEEASVYDAGVRRGGSLVTVHGVSHEEERRAQEVMRQNGSIGAEDLRVR